MGFGYTGNLLHLDLSTETVETEHPFEAFYRKYAGGSALNMYYLLKETAAGIDPQPYMSLGAEKVRFARRTQYFYSFADLF